MQFWGIEDFKLYLLKHGSDYISRVKSILV